MKMSRYAGATALLLVLGAPAYAQTNITQTSTLSFIDSLNAAVAISNGVLVNAGANQVSINNINGLGVDAAIDVDGIATGYVAIPAGPYNIVQTSGVSGIGDEISSINVILAVGTGMAVANVTAGGAQYGLGAINTANIFLAEGATGYVTQSAISPDIDVNNAMIATVQNGNAVVEGYTYQRYAEGDVIPAGSAVGDIKVDANGNFLTTAGGYQVAFARLNTGGALIADGSTTSIVKLDQSVQEGAVLSATNLALANAVANTSTILDPIVRNLDQAAVVSVNSFNVGGEGSLTLAGSQLGTVAQGGISATIGNTAVAYTGPTFDPFYNLGGNRAAGIAEIHNVTQVAAFSLNTIGALGEGVLDVTLSDIGGTGAFVQTVDGSNTIEGPTADFYQPFPLVGNVVPNIINGMAAITGNGSASITGVNSQAFFNTQNSVSITGALSGRLDQTATGVSQDFGYVNLALASAETGPASITGVSQVMSQTYNTVSAGNGSSGLILNQNADSMQLSNVNLQIALGSSTAKISGGSQVSNLGVNVADLGIVNGGTITQVATGVSLNSLNVMTSSAFNPSVGGTQSSFNSVNVIR